MLGDGRRVLPVGRRLPHLREQLLAVEHLTGRRGEERQQVELARRQRDELAADLHVRVFGIDLELAELQRRRGRALRRVVGGACVRRSTDSIRALSSPGENGFTM